nr:hypothetical protein [Tanacetum cinerariifolium]
MTTTMSSSSSSIGLGLLSLYSTSQVTLRGRSHFSIQSKGSSHQSPHRRIWRRRKLTKKDEMIRYAQERTPFVEEQLAAEANELVEQDKDAYGGKKKAILHAISNRMNDLGFYRPEAYMRTDPFKHITKMDTRDDDE